MTNQSITIIYIQLIAIILNQLNPIIAIDWCCDNIDCFRVEEKKILATAATFQRRYNGTIILSEISKYLKKIDEILDITFSQPTRRSYQ